jgi:hypothetical protein
MKKFVLVAFLGSLFAASAAMAANPLSSMKMAFDQQATSNVIPVLIFWTMILGGIFAFIMKQWMPLVMAIVISVVMGMSPTLSGAFTTTDFTAAP